MKMKDFAFKKNRVRATPVFAFYDLEGKRIHRHIGKTAGVKEFMILGRYIVEGAYKEQRFTKYKRQQQD
jgi:thioredoxin-related protein